MATLYICKKSLNHSNNLCVGIDQRDFMFHNLLSVNQQLAVWVRLLPTDLGTESEKGVCSFINDSCKTKNTDE